jgi:DNA-binding protein Fis
VIGAHAKFGKSTITPNEKRTPRSQNYLKSVGGSQASNVRDGREAFQERVESLSRQAAALTDEIQELKRFGLRVESPSVEDGIDFYKEVRCFEIYMIVQALKFTHGSQKKAAFLLRMNQTTLNSKN